MGNYTDTDIAVLTALLKWHREQENSSMTNGCLIEYIIKYVDKSTSRVRQSIRKLMDEGMMQEGIKKGLKKSYLITDLGINTLISIKRNVINVNN